MDRQTQGLLRQQFDQQAQEQARRVLAFSPDAAYGEQQARLQDPAPNPSVQRPGSSLLSSSYASSAYQPSGSSYTTLDDTGDFRDDYKWPDQVQRSDTRPPTSTPHHLQQSLRPTPTVTLTTNDFRNQHGAERPRGRWDDLWSMLVGSQPYTATRGSSHGRRGRHTGRDRGPSVRSRSYLGPPADRSRYVDDSQQVLSVATTSQLTSVSSSFNQDADLDEGASQIRHAQFMILEGRYALELRLFGPQRPIDIPDGDNLTCLVHLTGASPDFIRAWYYQKNEEMLAAAAAAAAAAAVAGSDTSADARSSAVSNSSATSELLPGDEDDTRALIHHCENTLCTTRKPNHDKRYSCNICGAGANDFREWCRHREIQFPLRIHRCLVCDKIQGRHIQSHIRKTHNIRQPDDWFRQIPYDPLWSDLCNICFIQFKGRRTETWKRLQRHIWDVHVKRPSLPPLIHDLSHPDRSDEDPDDDGDDDGSDPDDNGDDEMDCTGSSFLRAPGAHHGHHHHSYQTSGQYHAGRTHDHHRRYTVPEHNASHRPQASNLTSAWCDETKETDLVIREKVPSSPDDADSELSFFGMGSFEDQTGDHEEGIKSPSPLPASTVLNTSNEQLLADKPHPDTSVATREAVRTSRQSGHGESKSSLSLPSAGHNLPRAHSEGDWGSKDAIIVKGKPKNAKGSGCPVLVPIKLVLSEEQTSALSEFESWSVCIGDKVIMEHFPPDSEPDSRHAMVLPDFGSSVPQWLKSWLTSSDAREAANNNDLSSLPG